VKKLFLGAILAGVCFFIYKSMTIFVLPPMEPIYQGATIVMWKDSNLGFLASPDSVCQKQLATNSLVCRGGVMAIYSDREDVLFTLPYLQPLHWLSSVN
jgi:hypothetical protein